MCGGILDSSGTHQYWSWTCSQQLSWQDEDPTYSTEEVSDEDDQLPGRDTRDLVELFERPALAFSVQNQQILHLLQVFLRGQVIVDVDCALELFLLPLKHWCIAGW